MKPVAPRQVYKLLNHGPTTLIASAHGGKRNVMAAIKSVAKKLGNTPAVCRSCYVHPRVIDAYLQGTMLDAMRRRAADAMAHVRNLSPEEAAVLALLQRRLAKQE